MEYEKLLRELGQRYCTVQSNQIDIKKYWQKIIRIENSHIYDKIMKIFEFKDDVSKYNEERNKIIRNIIFQQKNPEILDSLATVTPDNYMDFLFTEEETDYIKRSIGSRFDECIKNISNRWLLDYIIYYFFQDSYYNFICNLFQMTRYLRDINVELVDIKHLNLYNKFCDLSKLSFIERINFFKENCDKLGVMEMFYDDMRKVKDHSYQQLVNSSLKPDKKLSIYNKELSDKDGVDVYYLDGEEFYAFIRSFSLEKVNSDAEEDYLFSRTNKYGYSMSYISNSNIGTIDLEQKEITLLYADISPSQIAYVHHDDAHTGRITDKLDRYISDKINEISTPSDLMSNTKSYNEIYIRPRNGEIRPCAIICYDTISEEQLAFAKKYHLSIVIINREKYKRYVSWPENYEENTYII